MVTVADVGRERGQLDADQVEHLQRLLRSWALLADLSFADLLLYVADRAGAPESFVVAAHVRATTSRTAYPHDPVAEPASPSHRRIIAAASKSGAPVRGQAAHPSGEPVDVVAIPVRFGDRVIAVLTSESMASQGRSPGDLERTYQAVFERLAAMVASGRYPFADEVVGTYRLPRVGDGALLLDTDRRVVFNSPNAVSALHRLGIGHNAQGSTLAELGLDDLAVERAYRRQTPAAVEVERGQDVTVVIHCIPLFAGDELTGGLALVRDVTDIRRRDRMLLSKDATIREIHHRVKNNLQTIASLLRLQSRRLRSPEAVEALQESVRRIASIALVHESLAQDLGDTEDEVRFVEVVRPLVRMVEEGLVSPDRPARFRVVGDAGRLPAQVAMPLAVVITELLQNAVDHAFPDRATRDGPGEVVVMLDCLNGQVIVDVTDDGVGIPDDFDTGSADGLGMTIVRTFVVSDLGGSITVTRGEGAPRPGTVVSLRVPLGS